MMINWNNNNNKITKSYNLSNNSKIVNLIHHQYLLKIIKILNKIKIINQIIKITFKITLKIKLKIT